MRRRPDPVGRLRGARRAHGEDGPARIGARAQVLTERPEWLIPAMSVKLYAAEHWTPPYMPPVIVAWRGGEPICRALYPTVDVEKGLRGAALIRAGMGADAIAFGVDTSFASSKGVTREEYARLYPPGSMQALWEDNPQLAEETLVEAISVWHVATTGLIENACVCYDWKGPGGSLRWIDHPTPSIDGEPVTIGGKIVTTLRRMMDVGWLGEDPGVPAHARQTLATERGWYLSCSATMRQLSSEGFGVEDLLTGSGPGREPTGEGGGA